MKYFVEWYEKISNFHRKEIEADSKEEAINIANNICVEPIRSEIIDFNIESVWPVE